MERKVVVVGSGVGGLVAAAYLAKAGLEVTVLEAHIYPGGCAATYFHRGYRFEAGATLAAGFYPDGPFDRIGREIGIDWKARPADIAMTVHQPGRSPIRLFADPDAWLAESDRHFGASALPFWRWQGETAKNLWRLALRLPPWPPQSAKDLALLSGAALQTALDAGSFVPSLLLDLFSPVGRHLPTGASEEAEAFRLFIDGQLLIAAQVESPRANALYGASALDLPRRGVAHLEGGIGAISESLVDAIRRLGGRVIFKREVTAVRRQPGNSYRVETKSGESYDAQSVILNLVPASAARLFEEPELPPPLARRRKLPDDAWGAFVVYLGIDERALDGSNGKDSLHHQVLVGRPLGEGRSAFISLSPVWDKTRAPLGERAATLSTHTALRPWWSLREKDREAFDARSSEYTERLLDSASVAFPGLRGGLRLVLPGAPIAFERFTRREQGWVGGFPQTNLFRTLGPKVGAGLWLVGDSIFPGQSVAAVALGGMRVARAVTFGR